jgi:hypothetical protein
MAIRTNNLGEDGSGVFPWSEIDTTRGGDAYIVRITALPPYRNRLTDELLCHVDWQNVTQNTSGRYANVTLPAKQGNEGRRGPLLRHFVANRGRGISTPSPVFPGRRP